MRHDEFKSWRPWFRERHDAGKHSAMQNPCGFKFVKLEDAIAAAEEFNLSAPVYRSGELIRY